MSLHLFKSAPVRTMASAVPSACRFNSTSSNTNTAQNLANIIRPAGASVGSRVPRVRPQQPSHQQMREGHRLQAENRTLEKFQTRNWKDGDIYSPHDLSPTEMQKWRKRNPPTADAFDALNINPLSVYKNFNIMSEYMTEMGRIRHSKSTGLRPVNQRKIAKAIRRAIGVGLMPSVHRHPEIIAEMRNRFEQGY